jgi:POT family proton-dependent oligopeptide transporter
MGVLSFVGGTIFWLQYRALDREEDELNMLPTGHLEVVGKDIEEPAVEEERAATEIKEKS